MSKAPKVVLAAQKLIWQKHRRHIPDFRISFSLASEPDQYRISYYDPIPNKHDELVELSAVYRLTISPEEYEAWQAWLDSRPGGHSWLYE